MAISVSRFTAFETLDLSTESTLICDVSPDGEPLKSLVELRMQGFRGLIILEGLTPALLDTPGMNWLQSDFRPALGFYLSTDADIPTEPLDETQWRHSATLLFTLHSRALNHDFKHLLQAWPERRHDLQRLWERIQQLLGQLATSLSAPIDHLHPLLYQADTDPAELRAAWLAFWQALHQGRSTPIDEESLRRGIHSLALHWPALLADRKHFQWPEPLNSEALSEALSEAENSALGILKQWLQRFNARRLEQPPRVLQAAQSLKDLRASLPKAVQQHLHNTLEQHLYAVAELLRIWQPVTDVYYPDLNGLNYPLLQEWQMRLPLIAPELGTPPMATLASSTTATKPVLLLLEDNPVWAEQIYTHIQTHPALEGILNHYQWVWADNLFDARTHLPQAGVIIADLSMPLQQHGEAEREHGIAFLESCVGKYQQQPPVVLVHTTPTHFLEDHLALSQAGIHDADYILKSEPESLCKQLALAHARYLESPTHHLTLHPHHLVLNGHTLTLSPLNTALLHVLAEHGPLSAREILEQLVALGYPEYQSDLDEQPRSGLNFSWEELLQTLDAPMAEALRQMNAEDQQELWRALQNWAALARAEGHQNIDVLAQRLRNNPWHHVPELRALLPRVLTRLLQASADAKDPEQSLRNKVSKMLHGLRHAVYAQCVKAQAPINTFQWIQTDDQQRHHLHKSTHIQYAHTELSDRWEVFLIEDDPVYAQEMQSLLHEMAHLQGIQLHCQIFADGSAWNTYRQNMTIDPEIPLLILLDLSLPPQANDKPDEHTGYQIWQDIQNTFSPEQYQVIVTSTLTHEDTLRTEGIRLGIPLHSFIPKGETLFQLPWPESLRKAVLRAWHSQRQGGRIPSDQFTAAPLQLALRVEVLDYDTQKLKLRVHSLNQSREVVHKNQYAQTLAHLLRSPGEWVSAEVWTPPDKQEKPNFANNLRNRLRKDIQEKWPLEAFKNQATEGELMHHLLAQKSHHQVPHFALRVSRVEDPHHHLKF